MDSNRASKPRPVLALMRTALPIIGRSCSDGTKSHLFSTGMMGRPPQPNSANSVRVTSKCTCASLLAAVGARLFARVRLRGIPVVSLLMPIVCNAVVVGAEITFLAPEGFALPAALYDANTLADDLAALYQAHQEGSHA